MIQCKDMTIEVISKAQKMIAIADKVANSEITLTDLAEQVIEKKERSFNRNNIVSGLKHFDNFPPTNQKEKETLQELFEDALALVA